MTTARINVIDGTFGRTAAGGVFGRVFLQVGDTQFPDEKWTDFVVVLLSWWCRALIHCVSGEGPIDVRFMEGPYLVQLRPVSLDTVNLELVEAGLKRRTALRDEVELQPLTESVLAATEQVLMECRRKGWRSTDTDELGNASAELRKALLRLVN